MSKFFVLTTDPLTGDQERLLADFAKGFSWWHWMPNFWLLRDDTNILSVDGIRDKFTLIAPMARCMVFQVEPGPWTGRVKPDAAGNRMEAWVERIWQR